MAQLLRPPCEDRPFDRTATETGDCAAKARPFVLAATILGSSMAFIDGSALTVALPVLRADFDADLASVQWVINAYVLSLAAFTLIGGSLADRLGRRKIFVWGVALFALASLACAFAPTLEALSAARFLQGVGGALLTPASLALISSAYPKNERSLAIGTWAAASAITGAIGPVLGGWLTERFGWPSIFLLNIPMAIGALFLAMRYAPPGKVAQAADRRLDWTGAALAALGFGLLALGLVGLGEGQAEGLSAGWMLGAGLIGLGVFVWWERTASDPMIAPDLFARPAFASLNLATVLLYAALSVMFFLLPFELIEGRGYTPTEAGLAMAPFPILLGVLSRFAGGIADRTGARPLLVIGSLLGVAGYALLALGAEGGGYWTAIFPGLMTLGLGFAILVAPLTSAVLGAVEDEDEGAASGVNNTASRVAQLLGVAGAAALGAALAAPVAMAMWLCAVLSALAAVVLLFSRPAETSPAV